MQDTAPNSSRLSIVNPVALTQAGSAQAETFPASPRPDTLEGRTIGLFWNIKSGGEVALQRTREQLAAIYPGARFISYLGAVGSYQRRATDSQLDQIASECDVVVGATAD